MSIALEVVRHNITDEYAWPPEISELFRRFSRPLPKRLACNDFQQPLPLRTREILEEALRSPVLALEEEEEETETRPVTDIIDTVLSSVRKVRAASAFRRGQEQARCSWISLITMLGLATSQNVYFSEDVSFLMPRTTIKSKPTECGDLEGKAVVLLSTFIPRSDLPCQESNACDKNKSESSTESNERPLQDPFLALDLPFDAYVTTGRGKRVDCCLPVVCAADEEEIECLVTSVVCQRFVWNMSIPVVGVSLSKSHTTATIVIGWSEVDSSNPDASPVVHIAFSARQDHSQPSFGIFDLIDPVSALYFGQFMLGLHSHFVSVERLSKNRDTRELCWRLDHVQHGPSLSKCSWPTEADPSEETWLRNMGSAAKDGSSISHRLLSSSANMTKSKPGSSTGLLQVPSHLSGVSGSKKSICTGHSASDFAALPDKSLAEMVPGTETWLWERSTLRLFRLKLPTNLESEFSTQFNEMIDLYNELTKFAWPKEWRGDNKLPYCDSASLDQRGELFGDYKQFYKGKPAPPYLEPEVTMAVASHMSTFLRIVSMAQVAARQAAFAGAGEAAMRSSWDEMFRTACCTPTQDVSPSYFVEKTMGLPVNEALGNPDFPDLFQSRLYFLLLYKQHSAMAFSDPIHDSLASAYKQASDNRKRSEKGASMVRDRSEPSMARVDGMYCFEHLVGKAAVKESEATENTPEHLPENALENPPEDPTEDSTGYLTEDSTDYVTENPTEKPAKKPAGNPGWIRSFFGSFRKRSQTRCGTAQDRTFVYQDPSTKQSKTIKYNNKHANCRCVGERLHPSRFTIEDDHFQRLYYPFIFIENKGDTNPRKALHQCQMYCIFGVEFLQNNYEITDFPVFGVVTTATEGEIIMAWKSSRSVEADYCSAGYRSTRAAVGHQFNVMVDRNVKKFDLTSPLQSFHFYISVHRIFKRQELLRQQICQLPLEAPLSDSPIKKLLSKTMKPKVKPPKSKK